MSISKVLKVTIWLLCRRIAFDIKNYYGSQKVTEGKGKSVSSWRQTCQCVSIPFFTSPFPAKILSSPGSCALLPNSLGGFSGYFEHTASRAQQKKMSRWEGCGGKANLRRQICSLSYKLNASADRVANSSRWLRLCKYITCTDVSAYVPLNDKEYLEWGSFLDRLRPKVLLVQKILFNCRLNDQVTRSWY